MQRSSKENANQPLHWSPLGCAGKLFIVRKYGKCPPLFQTRQAVFRALCYNEKKKLVNPMTLGKKIKRIRAEKGLSQAALEQLSGVNSKLLSKYENERIVPRPIRCAK